MMFNIYHSELNEVHEEVVVNRTPMYHQPMIQGRLNVARVSPNRDFWSYAYHYLFKAASASKPLTLIQETLHPNRSEISNWHDLKPKSV